MDYKQMTAPCGLACFECALYLTREDPEKRARIADFLGIPEDQAVCLGCRPQQGVIPHNPMTCRVYPCVQEKGLDFCCDCDDFPCEHLHPYADEAARKPHNTKVYNLCLIKKLGLEPWAQNQAKKVLTTYFFEKWRL